MPILEPALWRAERPVCLALYGGGGVGLNPEDARERQGLLSAKITDAFPLQEKKNFKVLANLKLSWKIH